MLTAGSAFDQRALSPVSINFQRNWQLRQRLCRSQQLLRFVLKFIVDAHCKT
ncbi:hypothetical protein OHAE_2425 [Ochrobactrum soli]|uniref:Uncharacterized protein n=1 Tax=Ochrobactrum soli TaxID=2448455 RepID=A0A2P9HR33_9HYPH|nr:hypothetical protein OHAE_2425 [[Ochrobactrum] soli]